MALPQPEGRFIFDSDVVFGLPTDDITVLMGGFSISEAPVRTQDVSDPYRNGLLFARDYYDGPTINLSLAFKDAGGKVWDDISNFLVRWRDGVTTPGHVLSLEWVQGGRMVRAWGRPRKFAIVDSDVADTTFQVAEATFQVALPEADLFNESRKSYVQGVNFSQTAGPTYSSTITREGNDTGPLKITMTSSDGSTIPAGTRVWTSTANNNNEIWWDFTTVTAAASPLVIDCRQMSLTAGGVSQPAVMSRTASMRQRMTGPVDPTTHTALPQNVKFTVPGTAGSVTYAARVEWPVTTTI